jgi:hypothetical protein
MQQERRNELAKQQMDDDCGYGEAKSVKQCWQDNNQPERKEKGNKSERDIECQMNDREYLPCRLFVSSYCLC